LVKYKKIAEDISKRIKENEFNNVLPTEEELIQEYKVSRTTIRSAIDTLVLKGQLYRVQGSGVYLRKQDYEDMLSLNNYNGLTDEFPNNVVTSKVLFFEKKKANKSEAKRLHCEEKTNIYNFIRIRFIDEFPYCIEDMLINKMVIPYLGEDIIKGSLYNYIEEDLGFPLGYVDRYIVAEPLPANYASLFNVEINRPSLVVDQKMYLENGTLFGHAKITYNDTVLFSSSSR